ncbi:MAG: hypothetical protein ACOX5J_05130 [Candidatus Hydrogenedentales bacterium]
MAHSRFQCTQGDFPFLQEDFKGSSVFEVFLGPVIWFIDYFLEFF